MVRRLGPVHFIASHDTPTVEDAYRQQEEFINHALAAHRRRQSRKWTGVGIHFGLAVGAGIMFTLVGGFGAGFAAFCFAVLFCCELWPR